MGRCLPRKRRVRRQAPLRTNPQGSKWLRANLIEAATAASRTKNTYLQAQYQRLRARRGHARATRPPSQHSILVAVWHMLTTGELYNDPGGDYFTRRDPERNKRRLVAQLERSATPSPSTQPPERGFLFRRSDTPAHGDDAEVSVWAQPAGVGRIIRAGDELVHEAVVRGVFPAWPALGAGGGGGFLGRGVGGRGRDACYWRGAGRRVRR